MIAMPPVTANAPSLRTLEQRIANQERRISDGVANGTISKEEGAKLRGELEKLQQQLENDAFDGNGLSRGAEFAKQLNHTDAQIKSVVSDPKFAAGKRLDDIDRRIKQGEADGSLTPKEAAQLKEESKVLRGILKDPNVPGFIKSFARGLINNLSQEVHTLRHNGELDGDKRVANFKERITAGLADGSLKPEEAAKLTEQVDALKPGQLDAATVNKLSKEIWVARHNATVDVPKARTNLESIIDAGEKSGRLNPNQVSSLRAQLLDIIRDGGNAVGARLNALLQEVRAKVQASAPGKPHYLPAVG